jgi:cobalt transporter subunit CbtB
VGGQEDYVIKSNAIPFSSATASGSTVGTKTACAVVFAIGAALTFLVGFSEASVVHDAAHDTRHGLAFPCH